MADADGLRQDPELLKSLAHILKFGSQDRFEVQLPVGEFIFSADLKREYIRENEHLLVRKFSRFPDCEFVPFGAVAQAPKLDERHNEQASEVLIPENLKEAIMNMIHSLSDIEANFIGRLTNEVVIDPIALYREF